MRRIFLLICTFAFVTQPLHAEMIVLKNGRVLEGKTVGKTEEYVTLEVNGVNHTYKLEEVSYMGEAVKNAPVVADPAAPATTPEIEDAPAPALIEEATEPVTTGTLDEEAAAPAEVPAEEAETAPAENIQVDKAPVEEVPLEEIPAGDVQAEIPPNIEMPTEEIEAALDEAPAVKAEEAIQIPVIEPATIAPEAVVLPEGTLNPEDITEPSLDDSFEEAEEMIDDISEDTPPEIPLEETDQAIE